MYILDIFICIKRRTDGRTEKDREIEDEIDRERGTDGRTNVEETDSRRQTADKHQTNRQTNRQTQTDGRTDSMMYGQTQMGTNINGRT